MQVNGITLLFLLFLGLKLTGYITWSWWWITSPVWIPIGIQILIAIIYTLIKTTSNNKRKRNRRIK